MTQPFVPFMVQFYFPGLPLTEVGLYTGVLEGSFHAGSVVGAIFWAYVADKWGRRPALLSGLVGTIAATLAFGVAPTLGTALAARFVWGVLNGNVGVAKTALSELCADEHSARAFAIIGLQTGLGRVVGPFIGGVFSEPARRWGWTVPLFVRFPFILPCLIMAVLTAVVLIVCYFCLEETRHLSFSSVAPPVLKASRKYERVAQEEAAEESADDGEEDEEGEGAFLVGGSGGGREGSSSTPAPPLPAAAAPLTPSSWLRLLRDGPVAMSVALYAALGFVALVSVELYPLYVVNDAANGGFSLDAAMLGALAFSAGPLLMLFQAFGFERLTKCCGVLALQRNTLALFAVLLVSTPFQSLVIGAPAWVVYGVLFSHFWILTVVRVACFISCFVLVANAALPEDRSRVNALGQAAVSAVRAIAPPMWTPVFAWSVSSPHPWPFNYHFAWYCCALMTLGTWGIAARLPASLELKRLRDEPGVGAAANAKHTISNAGGSTMARAEAAAVSDA